MRSTFTCSLIFGLAIGVSVNAQDATESTSVTITRTSGRAAATSATTDLDGERAPCFQKCYREYGDYAACPLPEDQFLGCWCSSKDWTELEEDCVWDVCGVDAHNEYGDTLKRVCKTVSFPPYLTSTRSSTGFPDTFTQTSSTRTLSTASAEEEVVEESSQETAAPTTSESKEDDTATTTTSESPSATSQEAPEETPNVGNVVDRSAGVALLVGVVYLLSIMT